MEKFINVGKEDYTDFLKYLGENGGHIYRPVTISDCTLIYEAKDVELNNKVAGRYFGGNPETYNIREDRYSEYLAHQMQVAMNSIKKQVSSSGVAVGKAIKEFANNIQQEYGNN